MVRETLAAFGRLDIVVNNAGITHRNQPMLEVDEATYDRVFAVNVKSIYWSAQHAVPVFRRQGGGCFVNIASTAGLRPRPGLTWYNGSKGAVILISKSMAVELAPDRIRVNAICPVIGETGLTAEFMGGDTPELRARFVGTIPLGRMSQPSDIAAASCSSPPTRPSSSPASLSRSTAGAACERGAEQVDARGDGGFGGPEVLRLGEAPRPRPARGRS